MPSSITSSDFPVLGTTVVTQPRWRSPQLLPERCCYRNASCCQLCPYFLLIFHGPLLFIGPDRDFSPFCFSNCCVVTAWRNALPLSALPQISVLLQKLSSHHFLFEHPLLRSSLLETLALVQCQRWPSVPLSLTTLCIGFFLTISP